MAAGDPAITDKALAASWQQRLGSSPVAITTPKYSSDGGYDDRLDGFRPAPREDADLIAILDAANARAHPNAVTKALARLKVATVGRNMDGIDVEAWLAVMGDALEEFPTDVVVAGCRAYSRREKWTPSEAELREECLKLVRYRRKLRAAARRPPDAPAPAKPEPRPLLPRPAAAVATPPDRDAERDRQSAALRRVREETARMRETTAYAEAL